MAPPSTLVMSSGSSNWRKHAKCRATAALNCRRHPDRQRKIERFARWHRKIYATRDDAPADIFDYIERFYNSRRRHSTLGQVSPMEFETSFAG